MDTIRLLAAVLLCCGLFAQPQSARAAESYDNCAGFIDTLPTTVSTQGVWCLRHDLATNVGGGAAITIAANNVTIDCNDFKIGGLAAGNGSNAYGIVIDDRQNATIRNCNLRGFLVGIQFSGAGHLVQDNRLDNNLYAGIQGTGEHNVVRRNRVYDTGGNPYFSPSSSSGIRADADILDNIVDGVFTSDTTTQVIGIYSNGKGTSIAGNRVAGLALNGGGAAFGVWAGQYHQSISGNRVIAETPINGTGIYGSSSLKDFCQNNIVSNFSSAMVLCADDGGNGLH